MSVEALTRANSGQTFEPTEADDWKPWVAATDTRNYAIDDPILDWLVIFGTDRGFVPDQEYPRYDPRTDFTDFVFKQGGKFETAVIDHLASHARITTVGDDLSARDLERSFIH